MGRKSLKDVRQREIIRSFYKVSKKEGLENASIAKTAKEMDMNPSLIMHYFPTKNALIYGMIDYILDKYLLIYRVKRSKGGNHLAMLLEVIDNIFSKKWNTLFDDGVSYSCFALAFRDKKIKKKYKRLLDTLRKTLEELIVVCKEDGLLLVEDPQRTADLIFVLVDGAYYYLSLVGDKQEYNRKLQLYRQRAIQLLHLKDDTFFE